MKLPNSEQAIIAEAKVQQYLLSETHEDGRHRAAFFTRLGFAVAKWAALRDALLQHARANEVANILTTSRGKHYAVEGELQTPSGRMPLVRSIWAIDKPGDAPRLITAYPIKRRRGEPG